MNRWLTAWLLGTSGLLATLACGEIIPAAAPVGQETSAAVPESQGTDRTAVVAARRRGTEFKIKDWKFTSGTKRLSWVAPAPGVEALAFYEGKVAPLKKSVLTYLPIASIRSIHFDTARDKEIVTVRVARSDKEADDEILIGPLFYSGFNTLEITGTIDTADKDQETVDFDGGSREGVRSIKFSSPKPIEPLPKGRAASVKHVKMEYPTLQVVDLQVLYVQGDGSWKTLPTLYFNDPSKAELANIRKLTQMRSGGNSYQVTLLTGQKNPRVIVNEPKDAGDVELVGFVGRFSAGYRIFPLVTVGEVLFEDKTKK
jgi:hypothetical protein